MQKKNCKCDSLSLLTAHVEDKKEEAGGKFWKGQWSRRQTEKEQS